MLEVLNEMEYFLKLDFEELKDSNVIIKCNFCFLLKIRVKRVIKNRFEQRKNY